MNNPLKTQIGGEHYKQMAIQPVELAMALGLNTCQANIIKYVVRHREKGGAKDLRKALHYCDLWVKIDGTNGWAWEWAASQSKTGWVKDFIRMNGLPGDAMIIVMMTCLYPRVEDVARIKEGLKRMLSEHYGEAE